MKTTQEKTSYCLGLQAGASLKTQFSEIDFVFLQEGFKDALLGKTPKLSEEEITSTMNQLKNEVEKQKKLFFLQLAERNKKEGEDFLNANKKEDGVVTLPSGLQYKVLHQQPNSKNPRIFDTISAHVRSYALDGRLLQDSQSRNAPETFPLNRVIPGWSEAFLKMGIGEKWRIFVPPYLAYGEAGIPGEVPPNATLIFDLELLDIHS